jgi:hypothetical protein
MLTKHTPAAEKTPAVNPETVSGDFKFLVRPKSSIEYGAVPDGKIRGILLTGVMPNAFAGRAGEELWDCTITLHPRSCKVADLDYEIGAGGEVTVSARLYIRHGRTSGSDETTMVFGRVFGNANLCSFGTDEMWEGTASITPLRKYKGTNWGGFRPDQIMCDKRIADPESELSRIFSDPPTTNPTLPLLDTNKLT